MNKRRILKHAKKKMLKFHSFIQIDDLGLVLTVYASGSFGLTAGQALMAPAAILAVVR